MSSIENTAHAVVALLFLSSESSLPDRTLLEALCHAGAINEQLVPALVKVLKFHMRSSVADVIIAMCADALDAHIRRGTGKTHEQRQQEDREKKKQEASDDPQQSNNEFLRMFREEGPAMSLLSAFFAQEGSSFLRRLQHRLLAQLRNIEPWEFSHAPPQGIVRSYIFLFFFPLHSPTRQGRRPDYSGS